MTTVDVVLCSPLWLVWSSAPATLHFITFRMPAICGMALLVAVYLLRGVEASCGWQQGQLCAPGDRVPELPATFSNSSSSEAETDGGDTPPPTAVAAVEGDRDPSDTLFRVIGNLWEEQNDLLVHMMEYYLARESLSLRRSGTREMDGTPGGCRLAALYEALGRQGLWDFENTL